MPSIFIEFELDSDELDDDTVRQTNFDRDIRRGDHNIDQSMPLLVGLLDASAVRRSLDIPMDVDYAPECSDVDLEELAAKQAAGGGMLSSMANMANSILGAGAYPYITLYPLPWLTFLSSRDHRYVIRSCCDIPIILSILFRFALRHEPRRVLYGNISPSHPLHRHRLDDTPHRAKRKAQRHEVIHRNHEPLFWLEWACGRVLFSIRFRIRWYVCVPGHSVHMSPHQSL